MKNKKFIIHFFKNPAAIVALLAFLMAAFFIVSQVSFAASLGTQVNTGLNYGTLSGLGTRDVRAVIFLIINVLFGFLGVIAVLIMLYAGWVWMSSGGDPEKIDTAKKIITNAIIGLIIIFLSYSIVIFVIRMLFSATGPGQAGLNPPPAVACANCGALGGGIIEAVFPPPGARDVPRNTMIFVTFKELMDPSTIIDAGNLMLQGPDNIEIYYIDPATNSEKELASAEVAAVTADNKTFIFNPVKYMGDGVHNVIYTVRLGKNIKKQADVDGVPGNDPAFPGVNNYYSWWFEVGTRLDLVPPQIVKFPFPQAETAASIDDYSSSIGVAASAEFVVQNLAVAHEAALAESPANAVIGTAEGAITGKYLGDKAATICLTGNGSIFNIKAAPLGGCSGSIDLPCLNSTSSIANKVILGCGLSADFNIKPGSTDQYTTDVRPEKIADTLRIGNTTYTFVSGSTGALEIEIGLDINSLAANIRNKINSNLESPDVLAAGTNSTIKLTAALAGDAGNAIHVSAKGLWANKKDFDLEGGKNGGTNAKIKNIPDQSRDVIIRIDFSEAMFPPQVAGKVTTNNSKAQGVGDLESFDFSTFEVFADLDNDGPDPDEHVAGTWRLSNIYKTSEFISAQNCGVCVDGITPCISSADCGGASCNTVKNSCGSVKKCLPVRGDATPYIVRVKTASLENCAGPDNCLDDPYNTCGANSKCVDSSGKNYPKALSPFDGVIDTAGNSLDGNRNADSEGPGVNYYIDVPGLVVDAHGDSYEWRFNINKTIDLTPPKIEEIGPDQDGISSLVYEPKAKFNKIMMSSTFLPDNSYEDGACECNPAETGANSDCKSDEYCDGVFNVCRKTDNSENFCRVNSQCVGVDKAEHRCKNQEYVTLIDTLKNTGYMIGSYNVDEAGTNPLDGFPDKSFVTISHSIFTENQTYHVDVGSGLKDSHQNCFLPSSGPTCAATAEKPYCCYGTAQGTPCTPGIK